MNIFHRFSVRSLKANRAQTVVTIIGIVLSAAMLTAVTAMIASVRHYGIVYEEAAVGDWHVNAEGLSREESVDIRSDERVERVYELQDIGYAYLEGGENSYKPYLCVREMNAEFAAHMPIRLLEGRMPENENEVLIPSHVSSDGGVTIQPGDRLALKVGYRENEQGERLWQGNELRGEEDADGTFMVAEHLTAETEQVYTVTGLYERPGFESIHSPGYTVLTMDSGNKGSGHYDSYIVMKRPKDAIGFWKEISGKGSYVTSCNNALLRFYGYSVRNDFNYIVYGMGSILIVIIVLGSVALIYNAFAISVSERTKQFGLLASIGATRKQMRQTVCFEAFVLCLVGVPAGILAGICGIGITISAVSGPLEYLIGNDADVKMRLFVSPGAVAAAAVIGVVTVLISAYLPMRRALAVSAVDAIRQKDDVCLTKKKLKIPGWVYRRFGLEGMIALKSFKRSKRRYRATILSLAMSILLFVSAGSFSEYLLGSYRGAVKMNQYDISVDIYGDTYEELIALAEKVPEAEGTQLIGQLFYTFVPILPEEETLTEEVRRQPAGQTTDDQNPDIQMNVAINFIPDDLFAEMLSYYDLSPDKYADVKRPKAVVLNRILEWRGQEQEEVSVFLQTAEGVSCFFGREEEADLTMELEIGDVVENQISDSPGFSERCFHLAGNISWIKFVYPMSAAETMMNRMCENGYHSNFCSQKILLAQDHARAAEEIRRRLADDGAHYSIYDLAETEENIRDTYVMIHVFCYGFIVLISLIAAANIFNTISTNLNLRRRESAMLKSLGMTQREFVRMLNLECLIYGLRGLGTGFLLAVPCTALMYYLSNEASMNGFYLPWRYFLISAGCVFLVVYASMLYGQSRTKKGNLMDELKKW